VGSHLQQHVPTEFETLRVVVRSGSRRDCWWFDTETSVPERRHAPKAHSASAAQTARRSAVGGQHEPLAMSPLRGRQIGDSFARVRITATRVPKSGSTRRRARGRQELRCVDAPRGARTARGKSCPAPPWQWERLSCAGATCTGASISSRCDCACSKRAVRRLEPCLFGDPSRQNVDFGPASNSSGIAIGRGNLRWRAGLCRFGSGYDDKPDEESIAAGGCPDPADRPPRSRAPTDA
jgi:hypothetical protein